MINYIEGPEVRITPNDGIFIDVEFFHTKEKLEGLEVRRLFPKSGGDKYIVLLDKNGDQVAIIRNLSDLSEESRQTVKNALEEYYMIPKILRFIEMTDKFRIWMWTAETDKGIITFEVKGHNSTVKPLFDGRVLITDTSDNRYEVPDYRKMDEKSIKLIVPML